MMHVYPWSMQTPRNPNDYATAKDCLKDCADVSEKMREIDPNRYTATPFSDHRKGLPLRINAQEELARKYPDPCSRQDWYQGLA